MRAVLVSRFPRVDTPEWKRHVGDGLIAAGFDVVVLYSRAHLVDQARAGLKEDGLGVFRRYATLVGGTSDPTSAPLLTLAGWAEARGVPVVRARRLSDPPVLERLRRLDPALLVLVGADIVPASMLELARVGALNAHYGLLPKYRGMNVTEWSVYNGDPVGVTVHLVDSGIDSGDILVREPIPLAAGETFASLRKKHQQVAARLLVESAVALRDGTANALPQRPQEGRQYYRMHPVLRRLAEARLAAQAPSSAG